MLSSLERQNQDQRAETPGGEMSTEGQKELLTISVAEGVWLLTGKVASIVGSIAQVRGCQKHPSLGQWWCSRPPRGPPCGHHIPECPHPFLLVSTTVSLEHTLSVGGRFPVSETAHIINPKTKGTSRWGQEQSTGSSGPPSITEEGTFKLPESHTRLPF